MKSSKPSNTFDLSDTEVPYFKMSCDFYLYKHSNINKIRPNFGSMTWDRNSLSEMDKRCDLVPPTERPSGHASEQPPPAWSLVLH